MMDNLENEKKLIEGILEEVKSMYPEAIIREPSDEGRAYRLYLAQSNKYPYDLRMSYIAVNGFDSRYFLFLNAYRVHSKDKNKILGVLKSIKECEEKPVVKESLTTEEEEK